MSALTDAGRIGVGLGSGADDLPERIDLLVVGLGITGAGVALDAATRGLSVVAVDAHDLAHGTSRWSSKLVHGGLRYLANGQIGVAHESAVERDRLLRTIAPHLTRTLPMVTPLTPEMGPLSASFVRAGLAAGDLLRLGARTPAAVLPHARRISVAETLALTPSVDPVGLRGALLSFDGQLEDDARLVVSVARTAAAYGAIVRTRARVLSIDERGAVLRDEASGEERRIEATAVINAAGVWAGSLVDGVRLRPSRGSHLVVRAERLGGLRAALMVPVPGSANRFVFALPQADGLVYIGLTDEPADGPIPEVPEPTEAEIEFLLSVVGRVLAVPLERDDVVGAYAGLRPLLESSGTTADLSRRHAVLTDRTGAITVVGGKLTTYRRMAEDAVDAAVAQRGLPAGPSRTRDLPLLGAADRETLAVLTAPDRLVRRYGTEAADVLAVARAATGSDDETLTTPIAVDVPVTPAELVFAITHEGARTVDDLLDRRTRVGLVPETATGARPVAARLLEEVAVQLNA